MWVFAYGSLMWRPDFAYAEGTPARLFGWHRAMCILSTHWRGTPERPGLVLGLDRGGSCLGRAFRVAAAEAEAVRSALHAREMISGVYEPRFLPVRLADGSCVPAWSFVVVRAHAQHWRGGEDEAARLVRQGSGLAGSSRDYLANTVMHLDALGIREGALHRLLRRVESLTPAPP
jgi:cation transport protein ChaC